MARNQEGYRTVTVHFIDDEWKHQSKILDTSPVTSHDEAGDDDDIMQVQRHTAAALTRQLEWVIDQWHLEGIVSAVVHDNASNVRNMGQSVGLEDVPCAAHTLQLSVAKGMDSNRRISTLVGAASRLLGHFRHSTAQTKALETKQKQHDIPQHRLMQCCKARWN